MPDQVHAADVGSAEYIGIVAIRIDTSRFFALTAPAGPLGAWAYSPSPTFTYAFAVRR
jgi:hypothetical protein